MLTFHEITAQHLSYPVTIFHFVKAEMPTRIASHLVLFTQVCRSWFVEDPTMICVRFVYTDNITTQ